MLSLPLLLPLPGADSGKPCAGWPLRLTNAGPATDGAVVASLGSAGSLLSPGGSTKESRGPLKALGVDLLCVTTEAKLGRPVVFAVPIGFDFIKAVAALKRRWIDSHRFFLGGKLDLFCCIRAR
jgi:hypothetical protein